MRIQIETPEPESGPELDPEERDAVETTEGPLVVAGPGSGKKRTLVERTVRPLKRGIDSSDILVAIFTEKHLRAPQSSFFQRLF